MAPRSPLLATLVLLGAVLAIYAPSLAGGFVWDDVELIVAKADHFGAVDSVGEILARSDAGLHRSGTPYYRPVTTLSLLLDFRLAGLSPWWFRLVNLALHVLNVLLLYALAARAFDDPDVGVVAALLFAVHPTNVEAVAFASARNNLLCAGGMLASLFLLRRRGGTATAGSLVLFAAALLSKEPAVALPFFLLGMTLTAKDARLRTGRLTLALFFALLGGYLALRAAILGSALPASALSGPAPRAQLVVASLYESFRILAFPLHLNALYGPSSIAFHPAQLAVVGAVVILLGAAVLHRRSPDALRAGGLWLLVGLAPISNLIPIPSAPVAERYLYIPAIGFATLLAGLYAPLAARHRKPAAVLLLLLVVALGARSAARTTAWLDDQRLFSSMVASDPRNASARYNLGNCLAGEGRLEPAIESWQAAVRLHPGHLGAHNNLANAYAMTGRYAAARRHYERARALDPGEPIVLYNLGRVADLEGRTGEAIRLYSRYVAEDGGHPDPARLRLVGTARERLEVLERARDSTSGAPKKWENNQ